MFLNFNNVKFFFFEEKIWYFLNWQSPFIEKPYSEWFNWVILSRIFKNEVLRGLFSHRSVCWHWEQFCKRNFKNVLAAISASGVSVQSPKVTTSWCGMQNLVSCSTSCILQHLYIPCNLMHTHSFFLSPNIFPNGFSFEVVHFFSSLEKPLCH